MTRRPTEPIEPGRRAVVLGVPAVLAVGAAAGAPAARAATAGAARPRDAAAPAAVSRVRLDHVAAGVLHLGSRAVPLPAGWLVGRLLRAGSAVLLEVQDGDSSGAAVVSTGGRVRELAALKPPLVVGPGGRTAAGLARRAPDAGFTEARRVDALVLVDLVTGRVLARHRPDRPTVPALALPGGTVLVARGLDDAQRPGLWSPRAGTVSALPGLPVGSRVLGGLRSAGRAVGAVLLQTPDALEARALLSGALRWRLPGGWDVPPVPSPDGRRVATAEAGRIVVRSAADGTPLLAGPAGLRGATGLAWQPDGSVVAFSALGDGVDGTPRTVVLRCRVPGGAGELVPLQQSGTLALPA